MANTLSRLATGRLTCSSFGDMLAVGYKFDVNCQEKKSLMYCHYVFQLEAKEAV